MVSRMHVVFLLKNVAYRLVVLTTPDIDPDPRFLHCLLHDAPPKPFEQGQSSCANLVGASIMARCGTVAAAIEGGRGLGDSKTSRFLNVSFG
ncbi:hypothetical protein EGR_07177 [Echinococcus granulosus]|uniref:Uncharacterized protein n=1 Tax=Echinococcus granulosus TaxID=6210 RepID=W6UAA1_ECHGR|nr:hypothetical protein EGR_07177 [Echinococcus granulosus]EUB57985.1 hypothetical protein EGR_07177 [Echinococcus granulosus]